MKATHNTIFGSILGKEIANFKNETKTLRGYCRAYRLKPNLKAYVKYAKQPRPIEVEYTHQWHRNGKPISGAFGDSYTLTKEDNGCEITCELVVAKKKSEMIDFITKLKNEEQSDDFFIAGEKFIKSLEYKFIGLTDKKEDYYHTPSRNESLSNEQKKAP